MLKSLGEKALNVKEQSISIIKTNQHKSGAYVACPTFETYNYCWLRDGSFIAYAMDVCGEHNSSKAYFDWTHKAIKEIADRFTILQDELNRGEMVSSHRYPPARFTLDGKADDSDWPNFQLDGYGTYLWALAQHVRLNHLSNIPSEYEASVKLVTDYLKRCWGHECYDCWEEHGDKIHPSTLGSIYGGLRAVNAYVANAEIQKTADAIRLFIHNYCTHNGSLTKHMGSHDVDASLLWLSIPFEVIAPNASIMDKTVKRIEKELTHVHGVHRYTADTYYGGGEWLLLSAWLGWYYVRCGRLEDAKLQRQWIEAHTEDAGLMPEQILDHVHQPKMIEHWQKLWGEVANPLLWSHAMYLILDDAIAKAN